MFERVMARLVFVLAVLLTIAGCGGDGNGQLDVHPAKTADERAAARLGERYAKAVAGGDLETACGLAVEKAAERLGCGGSEPQATACRGRRAFHAKDEGEYVAVQLDMCALHIARRDGVWRVIEDVEMTGYA